MTTTPAEQYDALRTLINLGPSAIPALVRHFNDRSTLPSSAIMVENAPEHWEAYAHYGIATVTDGLALVASILSNGPSCDELLHAGEDHTADAERDRCEQRWVAYVARGLSEGAFGQEWQ